MRGTMQHTPQIGALGRVFATQARAQTPRSTQKLALQSDVARQDLVFDVVELMRHLARELLDPCRADVEQLHGEIDS
jgi:hypothetical protein